MNPLRHQSQPSIRLNSIYPLNTGIRRQLSSFPSTRLVLPHQSSSITQGMSIICLLSSLLFLFQSELSQPYIRIMQEFPKKFASAKILLCNTTTITHIYKSKVKHGKRGFHIALIHHLRIQIYHSRMLRFKSWALCYAREDDASSQVPAIPVGDSD